MMFSSWKRDLLAGLAVFFVSVPLSLGVAHASGAPLLAGIVSAIIGSLVVGLLSQSQVAVSGPAAGLTAVCVWGVAKLGNFEGLLAATLLAGLLQLLFAALRANRAARMMPSAVVRGMIAAIGILLVIKQVPHLLGYDFEALGEEELSPRKLLETSFNANAAIIGVVCFGLVFSLRRLGQASFVIVVAAGVALELVLPISAEHLVNVPHLSGLHSFFAATTLPQLDAFLNPTTFYVAAVIAAVASLESLIAMDAVDRLAHSKTDSRRELVAQGAGNILAALVGGLPITVVLVRSSVNITAGAKTKLSTVLAGGLMVVAMLLFEPLMNRVPLASLAAILIYVGLQLIDFRAMRRDRLPFFVTIAAILLTNLLFGLLVGLIVAGVFALAALYRTANFHISSDGRMTRIQLGEDVSFFHKAMLQNALEAVPDNRVVYIDGSRSLAVDDDIIDTIERYRETAAARGISVVVGGIGRISSYTEEQRRNMDEEYKKLITNNREWVAERMKEDPTFFSSNADGQAPHFLFIGCSDSRVPAETITKTTPGSLFVHRNIANIVSLSDVNTLSVVQYSVDVLNVPHIIVCGHYGCGGVKAALSHKSFGLIDNWITPIKLTVQQNQAELDAISDPAQYERRVIELHVTEQVRNLYKTSVVQNAVTKYGSPQVHGWVYDLKTGLIKDLDIKPDVAQTLHPVYRFEK